jgi:hemerythrin-like domain-containing protein
MASITMTQLNVIRQTQVEKRLLKFLIEGLHNTFAWEIRGDDVSRKLSTLKFITRSFQSHMERLMGLEEREGYMDIVLEKHPELSKQVEALRHEHDEFRQQIGLLVIELERVAPTDQNSLNKVCERAAALLKKVDAHNRKEADIFQEAFEREEGGEG